VSPRDPVDDSIDDLYRGPLSDFTASRNALAKTLRDADRARVRALTKPTGVAWAVNQVYWHARPVFDRLLQSGAHLRKTQIAALHGKSGDVRDASEAHRRTIADAVREAERLAKDSGSQPNPDALMRTFEALSVASTPPEPHGRLTQPLQPAGFEALTGITPVASTPAPRAATESPAAPGHSRSEEPATPLQDAGSVRLQPDRSAGERAREEAAEARRRAADEKKRQEADRVRQAKITAAEAAVSRARHAEAAARKVFERAQRDLRAAEDALEQVRSAS